MGFDDAVKGGAMALFGEKYGDEVRVLDIGSSRELCGGTHVARTGDIGLFKIVSESGVAAGIRRIEAVCGDRVLALTQDLESTVAQASALLKAPAHELTGKLGQMLESVRSLEKELARLKSKLAASAGDDLAEQAQQISGVALLATTVDADAAAMREMLDKLKDKLKSAAIVLASVDGDKVSLIAGVTADLTSKVKAGELVTHVAGQIGGKGGGRPDMAQGGGTNPAALPAALQSLSALVAQKLG
jgi:alanyl-tRNA synthetase